MANFVGGTPVTIDSAIKVVKHIEALKPGKCEYYSYARSSNDEVFIIYNNRHELVAKTFAYVPQKLEDGTIITTLHSRPVAHADIRFSKDKKSLHVAYIKVEKDYENMGIGSELLNYIESYASVKRCKQVTLDCLQTFTNGQENVVYRGEKEDKKQLDLLKRSGKPVVDKNRRFYLKNGFELQPTREPQNDYLIPMVKTKLVYHKPAMSSIGQSLNFTLSKKIPSQKLRINESQNRLLQKMFKYGRKHKCITCVLDVKNARQL